jgi:Zonular occludens toxin (Zot)
MIYVYVGKPRNGKSLRAMMRILWTLEHTLRFIVTNMVLDLDEIQEWADKRGLRINARRRFFFLVTKEQMQNFWLYRDGLELTKPHDYHEKNGRGDVDYAPMFQERRFWDESKKTDTPTLKGTLYVIDEIHTLFPARGWQGTPRHADFYNSQHGKLNDEVIFITQNTKLVDPNFYRLAQEFHYCRNHRLMKHGRFRGANKFTAHIYDGPANDSGQVTLNVEEFALDLEVARCYDTSAGVGMPGGGTADAGARAKGIPLWTVWACIAAAIAGVYYVFNYVIPGVTSKYLTSAVHDGSIIPLEKKPSTPVESLSSAPPNGSTVKPASGLFSAPDASAVESPLEPILSTSVPERPLYVTGYVAKGSRINVQLSDGRVITEKDAELARVERNAVHLVSGQRLFVMARLESVDESSTAKPAEVPAANASTVAPRDNVGQAVGAWRQDPDGVYRLVNPGSIGKP